MVMEVIDMPDFGKALIAERSRRGLNQGDLAKLTECDIHTVIDIERGRVDITRSCFKEMVAAMDTRDSTEATR
jgi:ribosome-binding protein aMBF1 (putative translation factor)